jgi:hypothetical protein
MIDNESNERNTSVSESFSDTARLVSHNSQQSGLQDVSVNETIEPKRVTNTKCPTCNGTGKVNKNENKLVALIPVDDSRLKPKRIWLWIILTIILCGSLATLLTFLLVPRAITVSNDIVNVKPYNITYLTGQNSTRIIGMAILFNEQYVIQNSNFYNIKMSNLTLELTRINVVTEPELIYNQNEPIPPRSSVTINVKVKYIMYKEDDPYAELCINNIINQLFTLITTTFSFSAIWNTYQESHLKSIQYLTCSSSISN